MHARAVQDLGLTEAELLAPLMRADCHRHVGDISLATCPSVVIVRSNDGSHDMLMSVALTEKGWPRCIVEADKHGIISCNNSACLSNKHKCRHCQSVLRYKTQAEAALDGVGGMLGNNMEEVYALAAELEGLHLKDQHVAQQLLTPELKDTRSLPVSTASINPDLMHQVIQDRASASLGVQAGSLSCSVLFVCAMTCS